MNIPNTLASFVLALTTFAAHQSASGAVILYDLSGNRAPWESAVAHFNSAARWDLDDLPDFGVSSISGPLTSTGGGPIPTGFFPTSVSIDASRYFPDEPISLAFIGPSANGSGNTQNAIVPNQPQDSLNILFLTGVNAFELTAISCDVCLAGTALIDISVLDSFGATTVFSHVAAPGSGKRYGVVATAGSTLRLVNLSGPGEEVASPGLNQFSPGLQGHAVIYRVAEPGSLALLCLALFVASANTCARQRHVRLIAQGSADRKRHEGQTTVF